MKIVMQMIASKRGLRAGALLIIAVTVLEGCESPGTAPSGPDLEGC